MKDSNILTTVRKKSINRNIYLFSAFIVFFCVTFIYTGCKKLIDIDPPLNSVNEVNVYQDDITAISVLTGIYSRMSTGSAAGFSGNLGISLLSGLSADEFTLYNGVTDNQFIAYYKNELVSSLSINYGSELWEPFYSYIFATNAAIQGLMVSNSLTPIVKHQLIGEAKFIRAFIYFYLVNLFGDVPLVLHTDPAVNSVLKRVSTTKVYEQIISDLIEAQDLLSTDFLDASLLKTTNERVRPTKWAAIAMLARAYLFIGDYANAEKNATTLINRTSTFSLSPLKSVFLKNSNEAIWQLQPVRSERSTEDAFTFIIPESGPSEVDNPVYLSLDLVNSFVPGDERRYNGTWIDSVIVGGFCYYFPHKYTETFPTNGKPTEYLMMLRLAEQYLIRAEARAQQNKIEAAQADLNVIHSRSGLSDITPNDKISLLVAIMHERKNELFTEHGHRWLDLKRTGSVNDVMSKIIQSKQGSWQSTDQLYPILFLDIQRNPNLKQNLGY